jgi:hypothetical protein
MRPGRRLPANWLPPEGVVGDDEPGRVPLPPSPPAGAWATRAKPDELPVSWRGVPGQRRLQPVAPS